MLFNKRAFPRHQYKIPIKYAVSDHNHFLRSRVCNFSNSGICFYTMELVLPGSRAGILIDNYYPGTFGPEAYRYYYVNVKWSKKGSDGDIGFYSAGAEIISKNHEMAGEQYQNIRQLCDLCGRLCFFEDLYQEKQSILLCKECFAHYQSIPDGILKESVIRFMTGNVI